MFDAVLGPVAEQWARAGENGHEDFWQWRRSPAAVDAALPMGDDERRTMVTGWLLGQIIGHIRIPAQPYATAVQVCDAERTEWVDFPHPMLTPPRDFEAPYDWLPAVLESVLIAVARSHEAPVMTSLRPYQVLRRIYDDSTEKKAGGIMRRAVTGRRALVGWLAGEPVGAGPSAVTGVTPQSSVDERAALATKWLNAIHDLAGVHYMNPRHRWGDQGQPPGGGVFSVVRTREQASKTPMFRDLAPDLYGATDQLVTMVEECREEALPTAPDRRARPLARPPPGVAGDPGGTRRAGVELLTWPHSRCSSPPTGRRAASSTCSPTCRRPAWCRSSSGSSTRTWASTSTTGRATCPPRQVAGGIVTSTTLSTVLADKEHDRRRLCVVVPVADGTVVGAEVEQRVHEVVAFTGARVPTALIRAVVGRPGDRTSPDVLRRNGWHNVYVAPEAARGPGLPSQLLPRDAHPVELGRLAAPTIAALVGLWIGVDDTPLDDPQAPDGVRAARAFYRGVEAGQVEAELRARVLSVRPPLPEPGDHTGQAVYLPDPAAACRNMAGVWWERHEHSLVGPRVRPEPVTGVEIGAWALFKMFFAFVWTALRGAPHDLVRAPASPEPRRSPGRCTSSYSARATRRTRSWRTASTATGGSSAGRRWAPPPARSTASSPRPGWPLPSPSHPSCN